MVKDRKIKVGDNMYLATSEAEKLRNDMMRNCVNDKDVRRRRAIDTAQASDKIPRII